MRKRRVLAWFSIPAVLALAVVLVAVSGVIDKPLRGYLERNVNSRLQGYHVRVGGAHLALWNGALSLYDVVVIQNAHPDPPIAKITRWTSSVHWRALLHGRVVADMVFVDPVVHLNLGQIEAEASAPGSLTQRGWQDAVQSVYPFKINQFRVENGTLSYVSTGPYRPIELTRIGLIATNIRNILSRDRVYPSELHLQAVVFGNGRLQVDGNADFLARPQPGVHVVLGVDRMDLTYFQPLLAEYNVGLNGGVLTTRGELEYGRTIKLARFQDALIEAPDIEYTSAPETQPAAKQAAQTTVQAAEEAKNQPGLVLRVDRLRIENGRFAFIDKTRDPGYRIFLDRAEVNLTNLTNHWTEGDAVLEARGMFMGSGSALAKATFRPDPEGANFDMNVEIKDTPLVSMNNLWRTYANLDVAKGAFSFYSELRIQKGRIDGYIKPLFRDVQVFSKEQDKNEGFFHKLYEKIAGGIAHLLENRQREEVATVTTLTGPVQDPHARTLQAIKNLVKNAFIKAILPGFENEVGSVIGHRGKHKGEEKDAGS